MGDEYEPNGRSYLSSYPFILKVSEEILNIVVFVFVTLCGFDLTTYPFMGVAVVAFLLTLVLLVIDLMHPGAGNVRWYWIESVYCLIVGCSYLLTSTVIIINLSKGVIITGIVGYCTGVIYGMDTIDKYKMAITPRSQYVWNIPNMDNDNALE